MKVLYLIGFYLMIGCVVCVLNGCVITEGLWRPDNPTGLMSHKTIVAGKIAKDSNSVYLYFNDGDHIKYYNKIDSWSPGWYLISGQWSDYSEYDIGDDFVISYIIESKQWANLSYRDGKKGTMMFVNKIEKVEDKNNGIDIRIEKWNEMKDRKFYIIPTIGRVVITPVTIVIDVVIAPFYYLYAATHFTLG